MGLDDQAKRKYANRALLKVQIVIYTRKVL